jgi:hypothetical protein
MLELGEDLLNRVQIGRIFRQEDQLCASGADVAANGFTLVTAEIVHDDDVAGTKPRDEDLLDIVLKALAVDWTIKKPWGVDPVVARRRREGGGYSSGLATLLLSGSLTSHRDADDFLGRDQVI